MVIVISDDEEEEHGEEKCRDDDDGDNCEEQLNGTNDSRIDASCIRVCLA